MLILKWRNWKRFSQTSITQQTRQKYLLNSGFQIQIDTGTKGEFMITDYKKDEDNFMIDLETATVKEIAKYF